MSFPEKAIRTIIEYLTGASTAPIQEVVYATLEVLRWLTWLVWESGLVTVQAIHPTTEAEKVRALQSMLDDHARGVHAHALTVPSWLIPILIEILKKLLAP